MKLTLKIWLSILPLLGLILIPTASWAQETPLSFKKFVEPMFPPSLRFEGITDGKMEILVDINEDGSLSDWLPVNTSHPWFVRSVRSVIDEWAFNPQIENGKAVPAIQRIQITFDHSGVALISGNIGDIARIYLNRFTIGERYDRLIYELPELDKLPEPIKIVQPWINPKFPFDEREGEIVVTFFIDAQGNVRIPYVEKMDCPFELALAAYSAIKEWKFNPPTINGKPVVVRAAQPFHFKAPPPPESLK